MIGKEIYRCTISPAFLSKSMYKLLFTLVGIAPFHI